MATHPSVVARRSHRVAMRRRLLSHPLRQHEDVLLLTGFLIAVVITGTCMWTWPSQVPRLLVTPWIVLSALFLPLRGLLVVYAVTLAFLLLPWAGIGGMNRTNTLAVLGMFALMGLMYVVATSRARLGVRGLNGETLMVDLRDRLQQGSRIPTLPEGWTADCAVRSANGESFAGDFVITTLEDGLLEVVLVDVSGKGREAGSRSLHLSGAFGGLLGSVPPEEFLGAANAYLTRQRWDEGFATAIHVAVDLGTGTYTLTRAGHPPAAIYRRGSGTWSIDRAAHGPVLGVLRDSTYAASRGELDAGDAILIYSDGVIESPGHDLIDGMDRMLGAASMAVVNGTGEIADEILDSARAGLSDDRAVFVIRRA